MAKHWSKKKRRESESQVQQPPPQPPQPPRPHPLHIPLVVNQVMSCLGVTDLLRARLVCGQWNDEASKYLTNNVKLKLCRSEEVTEVKEVMRRSKVMFRLPLRFDAVHLEATLSPIPPKARAFTTFFTSFAPHVTSLSLKPRTWTAPFPLHRLPLLSSLHLHGNLASTPAIFPLNPPAHLPGLTTLTLHLTGRVTSEEALNNFASNVTALINAAPNLTHIIAPKKMDHRDETTDSYRDDTANHILVRMLASDRNLRVSNLKLLQIDAKLPDADLRMLAGAAAGVLPNLETLSIALSGASTRSALIALLRGFSRHLKHLSMSFSKTHGTRMSLTGFFMEEPPPLQNLRSLQLKNYPASVAFLGAIKTLESFTVEVRNIEDCFPTDRDDFFLQPRPLPASDPGDLGGEVSEDGGGRVLGENRSGNRMGGSGGVDPSKAHSLTAFHYIHNKEVTMINLFGDRCPFPVTRRVAMRFPLVTRLTLDNMTGESMACIIKYLPLLEELNALGGFYNDLSLVGASSKEQMNGPDFPANRKLPFIGDLRHLQTCSLATFSINSELFDKTDLLSDATVYYGLIHCKSLRRLTLGTDVKSRYMRSNFETHIGDQALIDLIDALNLISLKTVRCPLTGRGFREILKKLRDTGVTYSINSYEGPILLEEFAKKHGRSQPQVQIKRLHPHTAPFPSSSVSPSPRGPSTPNSPKRSPGNRSPGSAKGESVKKVKCSSAASLQGGRRKAVRKRKYGQYKF